MTLRERAYQAIKAGIVGGDWPGGAFLSERSLGEQLGMSQTPIRSALDRLEAMGLVRLVPNQGFVVQEISLKQIMDIYELRLSLETYAARQLTGKMDSAFFAGLDVIIQRQEEAVEAGAIPRYVELDRRFHEAIVAGLDNEEYAGAMSRIQDKFLMAVRTTFYRNKLRLRSSLDEHRLIRDALAGSDPSAAEELVRQHIQFVEQVML